MNKLLLFSAVMLLGLSLVACSSKDSENIETLQQEVESLKPIVTATPTPTPTPTTAPTAIPINRESRQSLEAPTVEPKEPPKRRSDYEISEVANLTHYPAMENCSGIGAVKQFLFSPLDPENISHIQPYGQVVGGHVTPIDHMYLALKDPFSGRDFYEVRAIYDGLIVDIGRRDISTETNQAQKSDWRVDIAHTCTFVSYLDLMTSLAPEIEANWLPTEGGQTGYWPGYPVKAGQVIGYIGEHALDFGVYDYEITLPGFINPSAYIDIEPWKVHTVDPFPYFPDLLREDLLAKMIRTVEPRAGKIDYDVQNALSGNWFEIGTNWYEGINRQKYWEGHLSIHPNPIDPSLWIIAVGHLETENNNFILIGNADPAKPSVGLEPTRFQLRQYFTYIPAKPSLNWWNEPSIEGEVFGVKVFDENKGTVLLEIPETGTLKAEVFLDKAPEEVIAFTDSARTYSR